MSLISLGIFIFIVIGLATTMLFFPKLLITKASGRRSSETYESGESAPKNATKRYKVKYYIIAIIFLLFKAQLVLIIPWTLQYAQSVNKNLIILKLIFFLTVLMVGYFVVLFSRVLNRED